MRASPGTSFEIAREKEPALTRVVVPAAGVSPFYPSVYQRCSRTTVTTSSDRAVIVVGPAQRVTVDIASDARIVGGVWEQGR